MQNLLSNNQNDVNKESEVISSVCLNTSVLFILLNMSCFSCYRPQWSKYQPPSILNAVVLFIKLLLFLLSGIVWVSVILTVSQV